MQRKMGSMGRDEEVEEIVREARESFLNGNTRCSEWRKTQLRSIVRMLEEKEKEICDAIYQDLGKHPTEVFKDEIGILKKSTTNALECLDSWMRPSNIHLPLLTFPSSATMVKEPLGLVLVISSWNFPLILSIDPVVGAIAAGNAVVLRPSEMVPSTSSLLSKLVPEFLDKKAIKVIEGGSSVCKQLLERQWDKIFFTGSPRIGRIVMEAAAEHLTPVTLELGGKCPCVADVASFRKSMLKVLGNRIAGGKWGICHGQACIAIDYVIVQEDHADTLVNVLKTTITRLFGENPRSSTTKFVNKLHFKRLKNKLVDPRVADSVVYGGKIDDDNHYIEPTILFDPPLDSELMTEEIFGPLLPIITVKNIEDSIPLINSNPKPLALYVFSENASLIEKMKLRTSSGSMVINDIAIQFALDAFPFGGVGQSGMGRYHGKYSFDTFSHEKPVLRARYITDYAFRYPPWNAQKLACLREAFKFNYVILILLMLGLIKAK